MLPLCACGGKSAQAPREATPAPRFEPIVLGEPIPGEQVDGAYRDEHGANVREVHRLLVAGEADRRVALLLGRRGDTPCVGASLASATSAQLDCFEPWENPPLVVKLMVGGHTRRRTDWLTVLGLARSPVSTMKLDAQSQPDVPLTTKSWDGFPWQAFSAVTHREDLGNTLSAFDRSGGHVINVELSWAYDPPCLQNDRDVCGDKPPAGSWSEQRDPVRAASGADESDYALVFAHPAIRRLAAGHRFFINGTAGWVRCDGAPLGSVVSLRIWPPVSFSGELPLHDFAKGDDNAAYREGRVYVEAERVSTIEAWVDRGSHRVVGIDLDAIDDTSGLEDESSVRITTFDVIQKPKPGGGPDDTSQCPQDEPGE